MRSEKLQSPQVVEMDHALQPAACAADEERGDAVVLQNLKGRGGKLAGQDGPRIVRHALARGVAEDGAVVLLEEAAQVAVGDATHEAVLALDHGGDSQPLF